MPRVGRRGLLTGAAAALAGGKAPAAAAIGARMDWGSGPAPDPVFDIAAASREIWRGHTIAEREALWREAFRRWDMKDWMAR